MLCLKARDRLEDLTYMRFFFNVFFFFFFFCDQQKCQSQLWNTELDFGWTIYKTEHTRVEEVFCSKCFIVSVISFLVYFDKQVHKKLEKKLSKQAKKKIKPWILLNQTRTERQRHVAALRHRIYFFSLTKKNVKLFLWTVKAQHIEAKSDSWEGEEDVECKLLPPMY